MQGQNTSPNNASSTITTQPPPTPPSTTKTTPEHRNNNSDFPTPSSQTQSNSDPGEDNSGSGSINKKRYTRKRIYNNDTMYDGAETKEKGMAEEGGNGKLKKKRTRVIKDRNEPKKPRNPYVLFSRTKRGEFNKKYPNVSGKEINSLLGKVWKELSDEEKKPYIKMAQDEIKDYNIAMKEYNRLNEGEKEDLDAPYEIDPDFSKPFVDFRSLLGSPISFGPFEANIEVNERLPDSANTGKSYVQKEIIPVESSSNTYQLKLEPIISEVFNNNVDTSQRSQQPQIVVKESNSLPRNNRRSNMDIPMICEGQNNVTPINQPQLNPQSNNYQNNPCLSSIDQLGTNLINPQLSDQRRQITTQRESEIQEERSIISHQQIPQVPQPPPQQPMQPMMPNSSSHTMHIQQSIPFDTSNYNNSHTEIFNCPQYMSPTTLQIPQQIPQQHMPQSMFPQLMNPQILQRYNDLHQQYQRNMMQSSYQMWQPDISSQAPRFIPTQPNHQVVPLQPSTRHNQMAHNQQMCCCHEPPVHNTTMVTPSNWQFMPQQPVQMLQTMQAPMMNGSTHMLYHHQQRAQNNIYQQNIHEYPHQMNWH